MTPNKKPYTVKLDLDLLAALKAIKERDGINESEQIRRALRQWFSSTGTASYPEAHVNEAPCPVCAGRAQAPSLHSEMKIVKRGFGNWNTYYTSLFPERQEFSTTTLERFASGAWAPHDRTSRLLRAALDRWYAQRAWLKTKGVTANSGRERAATRKRG